jgi:hypothetical protein
MDTVVGGRYVKVYTIRLGEGDPAKPQRQRDRKYEYNITCGSQMRFEYMHLVADHLSIDYLHSFFLRSICNIGIERIDQYM